MEDIDALPEDLSEMICQHGLPLTDREIGWLTDRIAALQQRQGNRFDANLTPTEMLVDVEQVGAPALLPKQHVQSASSEVC